MDSKNAIEIKNVMKSFRIEVADSERKAVFNRNLTKKVSRRVLDDITFNVRKGEVLGIIGRNGCGKSTLLSIIARIMEPDSGTVECSGKVTSILELGMGFHPDMSGRENIFLKGELYGFSRKEMESRIDRIIAYSGLSDYIDNPVRTYSSGMTGRLAFAIMVNVDSEIMLVDEILSVGDAAFKIKAREHFKKMAKSGKTVVFVSHSISDMEEMCSRAIWIENGKVVKDGPVKDVCSQYQLKISESPEIVKDLAMEGVAESQYRLALMYRDGNDVFDKDDGQYRDWLKRSSDQGHTPAQVELGNILFAEGNVQDAMALYRSAANRGNNDARLRLAVCSSHDDSVRSKVRDIFMRMSESGRPIDLFKCADYLLKTAWTQEDRKMAFDMFLKAAESYPQAMYQVAVMYRDGVGTAKDYRKMESYLLRASDLGHVQSIYMLAEIYRIGKIVPRDEEVAFRLYLKGAGFGNAACQYQVAVMYRDGIGCVADHGESERWFERYSYSPIAWNFMQAADWAKAHDFEKSDPSEIYSKASDCGIAPASWNVSILMGDAHNLAHLAQSVNADAILRYANYLYDVMTDYPTALEYYRKASDLGNVSAMVRAGDMYRDGRGTDQDIGCAMKYYSMAVDYGNTGAIGNILNMCAVKAVTDDEVHSRMLFQLECIANHGNADAARRLGNLYYDGVGVEIDYPKALYWYGVASNLGDVRSIIRLAEMYRDGKGVEEDVRRSIEYFKKAVYAGNPYAISSIVSMTDLTDESDEMIGLMRTLASVGNNDAIKKMAEYYYNGCGASENLETALSYYEKSASIGDRWSKKRVAELKRTIDDQQSVD